MRTVRRRHGPQVNAAIRPRAGPQCEKGLRYLVQLVVAKQTVVLDRSLNVVEQVGIGAFGQDRVLIVWLERRAEGLGLVCEIEHQGEVLGASG